MILEGARGAGTAAWEDVEADRVRRRPRRGVARGRARGPDHADLHVGHHRAAEGRRSSSHRNLMTAVKSIEALIHFPDGARVISWLPSAHIAERMAHHYLPIVYAHDDHLLPEPARGGRLPARGQADVVLRRAAHLGEAQGRHGGLPGPGEDAERKRGVAGRGGAQGASSSRPASRSTTSSPRPSRRATSSCSPAYGRCSGSTRSAAVNVGAAPTPRDVLVFFHAIGVPLAELWGMSETCGAG